jgi:hypothetical protein
MAAGGTTYDTGGDDLAEARGAQGVCATWWPRLWMRPETPDLVGALGVPVDRGAGVRGQGAIAEPEDRDGGGGSTASTAGRRTRQVLGSSGDGARIRNPRRMSVEQARERAVRKSKDRFLTGRRPANRTVTTERSRADVRRGSTVTLIRPAPGRPRGRLLPCRGARRRSTAARMPRGGSPDRLRD